MTMAAAAKRVRPAHKSAAKRRSTAPTEPADEACPPEPVRPKLPEREGHLHRRAEWFRKRSGSDG
jgi:hypothetical protein